MATATASPKKPTARKKSATRLSKTKKREAKKDLAATYNEFKDFEGQRYMGHESGRSHKW